MAKKQTQFKRWMTKNFVDVQKAALIFDVSSDDIENWIIQEAPPLALRFLSFFNRDLSLFHPDWKGYRITHDGLLLGPKRLCLKPYQVSDYPVLFEEYNNLLGDIHTQEIQRIKYRTAIIQSVINNEV